MNSASTILKQFVRAVGRCQPYLGLPLVYLSIALLCIFYILELTDHNLLLLPALLIPVGIFFYVRNEKHQSRY